MLSTPKELYTERITTLTEEIRQLNKHNRLIVVLELSAIVLAIACVVAYTMWSSVAALVVAALFVPEGASIVFKTFVSPSGDERGALLTFSSTSIV